LGAVSSFSEVWGEAPTDTGFGAYFLIYNMAHDDSMTTLMPFYEKIMTVFCTDNMTNIQYGVT